MSIEIIIGVIGLIIAIATYIKSQKPTEIKLPEPIEELENLKIHFVMNQNLSIEIQNILENYINQNNAADKLIFDNMTFSKYLEFVKNDYENCLSDKMYKNLTDTNLTRPIIGSMLQSLQTQNTNLLNVKNMLNAL